MNIPAFKHLLEPIELGPTAIRNRIFNPPHGTSLGDNGTVTDELIAYHEERAKGGTGLIILEGMALHPSYGFKDAFLYAGSDDIIPGMKKLGKACRKFGTPVFGQLFHAGRAVRLSHDGSKPLAYSASDIPDERYRITPVPMPGDMIREIIESYADAAHRLAEAGLDGVEILAGMGYLIAQFLDPSTNRRQDEFGGSLENRMRLLREIVSRVRMRIGETRTLGIRITLDEKTDSGMDADTVIEICKILEQDGHLDYFSVISGSAATARGWIHVFPPMSVPHAFVANDAARLKQSVSQPVLVAGRINQPQMAEGVLKDGKADMVGLARALISDPEFVNKLSTGKADDIRACVGCNQACVGHRLAHHPVSCIQNPVTGRELPHRNRVRSRRKKILVLGGGPGGMKAAITAAEMGHEVLLHEKSTTLGGQVRLAEKLPGRAEFGGVTTSLVRELQQAGISCVLDSRIDSTRLEEIRPDILVNATGAVSRLPEVEVEEARLLDSWAVIRGEVSLGQNVVIADWACDWAGLGIAQHLSRNGHHVRLACGAAVPGESIPGIVRDQWIGELHRLGVEMIPFMRFFGASGTTVYFQHMTSGQPVIYEDVHSIVSCYAARSRDIGNLAEQFDGTMVSIGDAISPRTVEEAVLEGYKAVMDL